MWKADPSTALYRLVDAMCGTAGAGGLVNEILLARMGGALDTIYFNELDYIFGKINFLSRSPAESYPYSPLVDMLTSEQWDEVRVKDAWFRSRIKEFFAACNKGSTPDGLRACVHAAIGVDADIYEVWRYCADTETEILTRSGYKSHENLVEGEEVLTLNLDTGLAEWQAVSAVNRFSVVDEEMLSVEMRGHSSLTTMDHRWPVLASHKKYLSHDEGRSHYGPRTWGLAVHRSRDLQREDKFIRAASVSNLPDQPKYTDSLVELIGWFITEGHCNELGYAQNIVQSHKVNPDNVERIRAALTKTFGPGVSRFTTRTGRKSERAPQWRESVSPSKPNLTLFRLNSVAGAVLAEVAPNKVASTDFINSLTESQLALFLNAVVAGDGYTRCDGYRSIVQNSIERLVPIQIAATLLGIATTYQAEQKTLGAPTTVLSLCEKSRYISPLGQKGINATKQRYSGTVWCPTTPNGTWFARRHGTHYFTGNTDNFGLTADLGRSEESSRSEVVIRPHKDEVSPGEMRLLRDMLGKIASIDTTVTVNTLGLAVFDPTPIASACADSTYFEVQKVVTSTPVFDDMPPPELLSIDLLSTEQWMFSKDPTLAPYAAFNISQESGYYYLVGGGARSPIDSVTYGVVYDDGQWMRSEANFESYDPAGYYTDWIAYEKADSPDNYPGGKFGLHPPTAPARNSDGTPYIFPYLTQQAYVDVEKDKIIAIGGIANDHNYKLPITTNTHDRKEYLPEYAIAYSAPSRDSTISSSLTNRRPLTVSLEPRDSTILVRTT